MGAADLTLMNDLGRQMSNKLVDLDTDTYKFALVTAAVAPAADDVEPVFGDYTEVTGDNYTPGGIDVSAGMSTSLVADVLKWITTTVPLWSKHATGPGDVRTGILYNDQGATKYVAAFVEMSAGTDISLVDADIQYTFDPDGIFQETVNA